MPTAGEAQSISRVETLLLIAQRLAEQTPDFFVALGEGAGNHRSNKFMVDLRQRAALAFGRDYSEAPVCGHNKLAVDFYFPEEGTVVEIAGMLSAPNSEYEKDVFKCLLAQECGEKVRKLVFIAKPGAAKVQGQAGRSAVADFVQRRFNIEIVVEELVDPRLA
jgi:hypothetical protein